MREPSESSGARSRTRRFLLITDLDGTLIPPEWDPDLEATLQRFSRLVTDRKDIVLAYATGRDLALTIDGILEHSLPRPEALVCDVGSAVYHRSGQAFDEDAGYRSRLESRFGEALRDRIAEAVGALPAVTGQEDSKQGPFKVSFYVDPAVSEQQIRSDVDALGDAIRSQIGIVFSADPVDGRGLLDVVPAGVSKGSAVRYLCGRLGFHPDQVVYAGDSGNDSAALLAGFNAILVGNAPEPLRGRLKSEAARLGILDRLYLADSDYVSGVLEGCQRFGMI